MNNVTLEALVRRLDELETRMTKQESRASQKDWRSVVGLFDDSELMPRIIAEGRKIREADRKAARQGSSE